MELYFSFFPLLLCSYYVSGKTCWDSTWYNESVTLKNGSNYEHQSVDVLNSMCPNKTAVINASCRGERTEPFTMMTVDLIREYYATCNHKTGLICYPFGNQSCPDFSIQYGCNCSLSTLDRDAGTPNISSTTIVMSGSNKQTARTSKVTSHPVVTAKSDSVGTETGSGSRGNSTNNDITGSRSATKARRRRCRNSAKPLESVWILLALSSFVLGLVQ
ncbi:uncharacterized protein LOC132738969 [Ruditapes philippinarum]|uniref:uncharacterized protein LOC132738969 n=1 Tax=Ruditapes philippinarum TaxID=129788 RepID=UPI00295AFC63|nr:uncharacterized protein LOC132738969 [Ruditapes philippinarum]